MPTLDILKTQPRWAYFMMWSGMAEGSNTPEQLLTMFHAPNIVNRGDPRLGPAPAPGAFSFTPVDPKANRAAHTLLRKLAAGWNEAPSNTASGPVPAFSTLPIEGQSTENTRRELERMQNAGLIPLVRWTPPSPTGGGQAALDDFEWHQLLQPGTSLHNAWMQQLRRFAEQLAALRSTSAIVIDPLPQPNAQTFWWGNRAGAEGSQLLRADLRAALAAADVHFVLWAADLRLAPPAPQTRPAPLTGFFSGPLDFDLVLMENVSADARRWFAGRMLQEFAGGKPILAGVSPP